jgi:sugar phosphate isomerase/epimerase
MASITRRDFLRISAAAGIAATSPLVSRVSGLPQPVPRSGAARLRVSLAAFSFQRYFPINRGRPNPDVPPGQALDMFKFVDYCVAQGCEGAELTGYYFPEETSDYLIRLRRHCFLRGISISGTAIANNFTLPGGPARDREIAHAKRWIDHAARLGAPHIRVFIGQNDAVSRAEAEKLAIAALEECGEYAGRQGIFLGVENHDVSNSAARLVPFIKSVGSPWVGINIDPGFNTADPYHDFAACLPYTVNIQFRPDFNAMGKPQVADLRRLARLMRERGYQGWIALKYESPEDPMTAVPRILQEMRAAFAG